MDKTTIHMIQVLLFLVGCTILYFGPSQGMGAPTFMEWVGIALCLVGIGGYHLSMLFIKKK
jgi:steroid 5-alpha reductase family enzyme